VPTTLAIQALPATADQRYEHSLFRHQHQPVSGNFLKCRLNPKNYILNQLTGLSEKLFSIEVTFLEWGFNVAIGLKG
jgi:hypothetical protein